MSGPLLRQSETYLHGRIAQIFPAGEIQATLQRAVHELLESLDCAWIPHSMKASIRLRPGTDVHAILAPIQYISTDCRRAFFAVLEEDTVTAKVLPSLRREHIFVEDVDAIERDIEALVGAAPDPARSENLRMLHERLVGPQGQQIITALGRLADTAEARGPRTVDNLLIPTNDMRRACQTDPQAMPFVDAFAREAMSIARDMSALHATTYRPRSPVATNGSMPMTKDDLRDIRATSAHLLSAAVLSARYFLGALRQRLSRGTPPEAMTDRILFSGVETAFLTFVRSRFPALFWELESDSPAGGEQQERINQSWKEIMRPFIKLAADAAMVNGSSLQEHHARIAAQYAKALGTTCSDIAALQLLANCLVLRPPDPEQALCAFPLTTAPDITAVLAVESEIASEQSLQHSHVYVTNRAPAVTHNVRQYFQVRHLNHMCEEAVHAGRITLHHPHASAGLQPDSLNQLTSFFPPEHQILKMSDELTRAAHRSLIETQAAAEHLGIGRMLHMGAEIPAIIYAHRHITLSDHSTEAVSYFVLPEEGARALDVFDECMPLPEEERIFLTRHGVQLPEHPVLLPEMLEIDDEDL